jgi:hypothetical protein
MAGKVIEVLQGVVTDAGLPTLAFRGLADNCAIAQLGGASLAGWDAANACLSRPDVLRLGAIIGHWPMMSGV